MLKRHTKKIRYIFTISRTSSYGRSAVDRMRDRWIGGTVNELKGVQRHLLRVREIWNVHRHSVGGEKKTMKNYLLVLWSINGTCQQPESYRDRTVAERVGWNKIKYMNNVYWSLFFLVASGWLNVVTNAADEEETSASPVSSEVTTSSYCKRLLLKQVNVTIVSMVSNILISQLLKTFIISILTSNVIHLNLWILTTVVQSSSLITEMFSLSSWKSSNEN